MFENQILAGPAVCPWCGQPFRSRRSGGRPQRFCCPAEGKAYWESLRLCGLRELQAGRVSLPELREIFEANRKLDSPSPDDAMAEVDGENE